MGSNPTLHCKYSYQTGPSGPFCISTFRFIYRWAWCAPRHSLRDSYHWCIATGVAGSRVHLWTSEITRLPFHLELIEWLPAPPGCAVLGATFSNGLAFFCSTRAGQCVRRFIGSTHADPLLILLSVSISGRASRFQFAVESDYLVTARHAVRSSRFLMA